jgi:flagellar motor switch/type III secretory pathway protein FliN
VSARPYKLFGSHERAALAAALEEAVAGWSAAWLPAPAAARVQCAPAQEARPRSAAEWARLAATPHEWIAIAAGDAGRQALARALCGGADPRLRSPFSGESEIGAEVARAALEDLAATLLGARDPKRLFGEAGAPAQDAFAAGSACYGVEVAFGAETAGAALLVTSADWTLRLLRARLGRPPAARLAERRAALAGQPIALRVLAGAVEMDVRALRGLAAGDVIALDARIDRPLEVTTASGAPLCHAQLGVREGRRAAALSSLRS